MYWPFASSFFPAGRRRSAEQIRREQWRAFKRILSYACLRSPFYRDKFGAASLHPEDIRTQEDIALIPVTTRQELSEAGDRILARGYRADRCMRSTTSGVSGMPLTSYFDPVAWGLLKYAAKYRARRACGLRRGARVVNLAPLDRSAVEALNGAPRLRDLAFELRYLSIWDDAESNIGFINGYRPEAWYSLGSYLAELADGAQRNRWRIASPGMIFTSGELLTERARRAIEDRFHAPVYDIYGSTELKEIAWQCPERGGYHINEELCLVEFLQGGKRSDQGAVTVTSLVNRAMPLIRYQTGDQGERVFGRCACGLPFSMMRPTEGRCIDYLVLPGGERVSPYRLTVAVEAVPGVLRYQIVQTAPARVEVQVVPGRGAVPGLLRGVEAALRTALPGGVAIEVRRCDRIPRDRSGKARTVVCGI